MKTVFQIRNPWHSAVCHNQASVCRRIAVSTAVCIVSWLMVSSDVVAEDEQKLAREKLVRDRIATAGVTDSRVLDSMRNTPRHEFVPDEVRKLAYFDMALPIGEAQTISSPFIVAMMTQALDPQPTDKVLEIGTGSGYQAAVLSPLVEHVYTIEIVHELGRRAEDTLQRLEYKNVSVRIGDGFLGWPEAAPFDKIIVTCSPESVPTPLVEQLREGGQMIIPVGERYQQTLYRMTKRDGKLKREPLRPTLFVPMTGEAEQARERHHDPTKPAVVNGDFETAATGEKVAMEDYVPGWYYGRQVQRMEASDGHGPAPQGEAYVRFSNQTPGLNSHLLQGIAIDGRKISTIRLSGKIRTGDVRPGPTIDARPMIALSLYDDQRRELGAFWLGPFRASRPWRSSSRLIRIPPAVREAVLRVGLFGATGTADFDQIRVEPVDD